MKLPSPQSRTRLVLCAALSLLVASAGCSGADASILDDGADTSSSFGDAESTPASLADAPPAHDASPDASRDGSDQPSGADASAQTHDAGACGAACRLVFVTSATFTGDLQGRAGADARCKAAAGASTDAALKSRAASFVAWISSGLAGSPGPGSRLANAEYRRADGALVARDLGDLLSGTLQAPINVTERGDLVGPGVAAWTGTTANGTTSLFTCNGWSTQFVTAVGDVGTPPDTGAAWTTGATATCSAAQRIYCIEAGK